MKRVGEFAEILQTDSDVLMCLQKLANSESVTTQEMGFSIAIDPRRVAGVLVTLNARNEDLKKKLEELESKTSNPKDVPTKGH
jgi:hypothetical protein